MSQTTYETIKTQTLAIIEDITLNPKPTYRIDGQTFEHAEYLATLTATIDWVDRKLAELDSVEVRTRGAGA